MTENNTAAQTDTVAQNDAPQQEPIVFLRGLTKTFGTVKALDEISLFLPEGRIVGLLGPNGCGKTTLIKILAGITPEYSGEVRVGGKHPGRGTKSFVSYLPDGEFLPGGFNAVDAISYYRDFFADFDSDRAYAMLKNFQLSPEQKIKTMSKGMREKVQLALVMSRRARLYLLDEPLGGIDPVSRDAILNQILENYCVGSTMLISTHLIHDIERIFDDCVLLNRGRVVSYRNVDAMRSESGKSLEEQFKEVFGYVR